MKIIFSSGQVFQMATPRRSPGVKLRLSSVGPLGWLQSMHGQGSGLDIPITHAAVPGSIQLLEVPHMQGSGDGNPHSLFAWEPLPGGSWGCRRKSDYSRIIENTAGIPEAPGAATRHCDSDRWLCLSLIFLPSFPVCSQHRKEMLGHHLESQTQQAHLFNLIFLNSTKGGNRRPEANKQSHGRGEGRRETKIFSYTRQQFEQLWPQGSPFWWTAQT